MEVTKSTLFGFAHSSYLLITQVWEKVKTWQGKPLPSQVGPGDSASRTGVLVKSYIYFHNSFHCPYKVIYETGEYSPHPGDCPHTPRLDLEVMEYWQRRCSGLRKLLGDPVRLCLKEKRNFCVSKSQYKGSSFLLCVYKDKMTTAVLKLFSS